MDSMQDPTATPTIDPPMPTPPEETHEAALFSQHVHPFVAWTAVLSMVYFVVLPVVTFMA